MFVSNKVKYAYFCDPVISPWGINPTEMSDYVHQTTDQNIYSSFVNKVQKKWKQPMSINKRMSFFFEHSYNKILHNKEKE